MRYNLFDKEELIIQEAEKKSSEFSVKSEDVVESLKELIKAYRFSLLEQQRLIRVSDLQQENLRQTTRELDEKNHQLEEQAKNLLHLNQLLEQEIEQRKKLEQELQQMVTTDTLTGAWSRRKFWETGEHELERRKRSLEPMAVLVMDIDHFKLINDRFGHLVGDEALCQFVNVCKEGLRAVDGLARIGGEEFGVILPGADKQVALIIAERIRAIVADAVVQGEFGQLQFTVSIGVAEAIDEESFAQLVNRADSAMYEAKKKGRNRVECYVEVAK